MRMRWFGHPWPNDTLRAPVCEDDADRVELPPGVRCSYCERAVLPNDQGVVMAAGVGVRNGFEMVVGARRHNVVAEHLDCLLYQTLGYRRMPGQPPARAGMREAGDQTEKGSSTAGPPPRAR